MVVLEKKGKGKVMVEETIERGKAMVEVQHRGSNGGGRIWGNNGGGVRPWQHNQWANIYSVNISSVTRPLHPRPDMCTPGDREYSSLSRAALCALKPRVHCRVPACLCVSTVDRSCAHWR